jgi:hypothetical protein
MATRVKGVVVAAAKVRRQAAASAVQRVMLRSEARVSVVARIVTMKY